MTNSGGANSLGAIFKIKPDGTGYADLLDFAGSSNGEEPYGSLISDGTFLYGMTYYGGTGTCTDGCGTVFKYNLCTPVIFSQSPILCAGQSVTVGNNTYAASGTYTDTLLSYQSCDSIITTNLTVNSTYSDTNNITINNGDSIFVGGNTYTTTGTYTDTLIATNGCDSIITTNLTVLTAISAIAETNTKVEIFPNPSSGKFTIISSQVFSRIEIYNVLGEKVFSTLNIKHQTSNEIDLSNQLNGIYFVRMKSAENIYNQKLLKQ